MTPFDWFSSLLKLWVGAVGLAPGVISFGAGLVAWANAAPATRMTPAKIRQSRGPMIRMRLNASMCGAFPEAGALECAFGRNHQAVQKPQGGLSSLDCTCWPAVLWLRCVCGKNGGQDGEIDSGWNTSSQAISIRRPALRS
jgi:hypothetical protein